MRLVADIGGTNSRLALSNAGTLLPQTAKSFTNDEWGHFYDILTAYLVLLLPIRISDVVIALAGPVQRETAALTNRDWAINTQDLQRLARCEKVVLLNDLTALGHASSVLEMKQLDLLHKGTVQKTSGGQSLVVGIGTGFNACPVIRTKDLVQCFTIEAGHMSTPVSISKRLNRLGDLAETFPTVETLFSGRGFTKFCRLVCKSETLEGFEAIERYGKLNSDFVTDAVRQYSALLGQLLYELSLAYLPNAGIYLAGSVARAVTNVAPNLCTEVFIKPCNIRSGATADLFVIKEDQAALRGCAAIEY